MFASWTREETFKNEVSRLGKDCQAKKIPAKLLCWRKLVWRSHEQNPSLEALESQEKESSEKIQPLYWGCFEKNTAVLVDCLEYRPGGAEIARKNPSKENSVGSEEKNILKKNKKIESSTLKIKLLKLMNTGLGEPRLFARILPRISKKRDFDMKMKLLKLRNPLNGILFEDQAAIQHRPQPPIRAGEEPVGWAGHGKGIGGRWSKMNLKTRREYFR